MALVRSYWIVFGVPGVNRDLSTVVMEGLAHMIAATLKMLVLGVLQVWYSALHALCVCFKTVERWHL